MHRALTVVVVVALLAGSVPAAATLADGTPSEAEPGASFSGVVGVQEAEVNNEVADRSLDKRLTAAKTNESKASVVASESEELTERLAELEAEKERLKEAYENGSISKGEYQARLAVLGAELRAVERQANQTANVAETLPEAALRERGANVSEVRRIAKQANESSGGEVAEAARSIAGEGVGNGLGNAPNASERGPPGDVGNDGAPGGDTSEQKPTDTGPPSDVGNGDDPANASNGSDRGNDANSGAIGGDGTSPDTATEWNDTDRGNGSDAANRSTTAGNESDRPTDAGNGSAAKGNESEGSANESTSEDGQNQLGFGGSSDWLSSVGDALSGLESTFSDATHVTVQRTTTT